MVGCPSPPQPKEVVNTKGNVVEPRIRTLAQMIAACRFPDRVISDINERNFPVKPELFTADDSKLFHFKGIQTMKQAEDAIRNEGYEFDPIEKLLAFAAADFRASNAGAPPLF